MLQQTNFTYYFQYTPACSELDFDFLTSLDPGEQRPLVLSRISRECIQSGDSAAEEHVRHVYYLLDILAVILCSWAMPRELVDRLWGM